MPAPQTSSHETIIRLPDAEVMCVRIAISPMHTVAASIFEVIVGWNRGAPESWRRYVLSRCEGLDLRAFAVFAPPERVVPLFLVPVPTAAKVTFEEAIEELRRLPPERLRDDIAREFGQGEVPCGYGRFLTDPEPAKSDLCDTLDAYWDRVFKPLQRRIENLLAREVLRLGEALATEGPPALLARISHRVSYADGVLRWPSPKGGTIPLADRRLVLVPMLSGPDALLSTTDVPGIVKLAYAAPGAGLFWGEADNGEQADALAELMGATRAQVMLAVQTAASTADVADQLGISPTLASHHLGRLRRQDLVEATRFGRRVYYRLTERGRQVRDAMAA
jgi:DNA-binding transcriptional ArsR family regulator